MKSVKKYFIAVLILSFQITIFGQFNTLTPTLPKKTETPKVIEQAKGPNNLKPKKEKKSWKDVFNITSKADLKKELDSLKTLLKENSSANNKRWKFKKSQDSLILVAQTKMLAHSQNNRYPFIPVSYTHLDVYKRQVLNRTLRLVNSKHNLPGGIIADEFPTIYIHKIDNVVATARSNRVAVLLGLQELPQLRQFYKKEVADTISAIVGNILSGSARDKNTLEWLEKLFGKIKQKSYSQSISQQGTTTSINEKMDFMIRCV